MNICCCETNPVPDCSFHGKNAKEQSHDLTKLKPLTEYDNEEIVQLFEEICCRVGMYNTGTLVERMKEIHSEILSRLSTKNF